LHSYTDTFLKHLIIINNERGYFHPHRPSWRANWCALFFGFGFSRMWTHAKILSFSLSVVDFFFSSSFLGDDDDDDDDKTDLSQRSLLMRFFRMMNNR